MPELYWGWENTTVIKLLEKGTDLQEKTPHQTIFRQNEHSGGCSKQDLTALTVGQRNKKSYISQDIQEAIQLPKTQKKKKPSDRPFAELIRWTGSPRSQTSVIQSMRQ